MVDHWKVIEAFIRDYGIVAHQINSYNEFIDVSIPEILRNLKIPQNHEEPIQKVDIDDQKVTNLQISFSNPRLGSPQLENEIDQKINSQNLIHACRNQNQTYAAPLYVDVTVITKSYIDDPHMKNAVDIEKDIATVILGYIPVMLKSAYCIMSRKTLTNSMENPSFFKECPNDPGGYFIINGGEKVIVGQERMAGNRVYVLPGKTDTITAEIRCISQERKGNNIFSLKYIHPAKKVSRSVRATIHFIPKKDNIRLILLFYALGVTNPEDILRLICYDCSVDSDLYNTISNELVDSFEECKNINSQQDALDHITSMLPNDNLAFKKLSEELFPHIGTTELFFPAKAHLLGYMTRRLLDVAHGRREFDSRDHYGNKRIDFSANLLSIIFRKSLLKITKYVTDEARRQLGKLVNNKTKIVIPSLFANCNKTINKDLSYALATGNWGTNSKNGQSKTGISQALSRLNYKSFISHLRRVTTPSGKNSTTAAPRQLHNTQFGMICPHETPEGSSCVTKDTLILKDDNLSLKRIDELKNGDKIITVNPISYKKEISEIFGIFEKEPSSLYLVKTITGRTVKATGDHPFLTNDGWINAEDIDISKHNLCIYPSLDILEFETQLHNILTVDEYKLKLSSIYQTNYDTRINKYIKTFESLNYFPLSNDSKYVPILARLFGAIITDGTTSVDSRNNLLAVHFILGQETDAQQLCEDIKFLGFQQPKYKYRETSVTDKVTKRVSVHHTWRVNLFGALASLLFVLGIELGKKTTKNSPPVPNWIMNGSPIIKREFLGGLMGGDGSKIASDIRTSRSRGSSIRAPRFINHKRNEFVDSLKYFNYQIQTLFQQFNIKSTVYTKQIDDISEVTLQLKNSHENIFSFITKIGYRYCSTKQNIAFIISEYLRYYFYEIQKVIDFRNKVYELYDLGTGPKKISEILSCRIRLVSSALELRKHNKHLTTPTKPRTSLTIHEFFYKVGLPENNKGDKYTLFIPIESIVKIPNETVMDFTTVSENHSLVSNGFVTHNCGFVKNLSLGCHISTRCNFAEDYDHILTALHMNPITNDNLIPPLFEPRDETDEESFRTNIFVNGACKGFTSEPINFYLGLKDFKLKGQIPFDVSIFWEGQDIHITSDEGRACRPLFVCEDGYLKITDKEIMRISGDTATDRWPYLVNNGFVEYVDCYEHENIALLVHPSEGLKPPEDLDYLPTHTEIDPILITGALACAIAFAECNPSPRICYGSGMGKQGEGLPYLNFQSRFDSQGHFLCYPQKPLVPTKPAELLKYSEMSSGQMANVAICCYSGYNQEDACIVNQSAVDRGLFRSFTTRTYVAVENKSNNTYEEVFGRPSISSERNSRDPGKVSKLDADGLVSPGTPVTVEDLIIGKISNAPTAEQRKTCNSTRLKFGENGVTDAVLCTMNEKKQKVAKVRVRSYRIPEAGDKLASNFSQKHIISILLPHEDMPFTSNGLVPDIIMNPHSLPSRATIGHVLEGLLGKAVALSGKHHYGTPFSHLSAEEIGDLLHQCGYQRKGHEEMYDGYTGKSMKMLIFMGPTFYNRLKHMVFDKIHARARGPTASLTHQPAEGRSRDGGLRLGEMERDAMIAHGAAGFLREKLFLSSDNYQVVVCKDCGLMANTNLRTNTSNCEVCKKNNVATVNLPYAAKLLIQEIGAMGIAARINV